MSRYTELITNFNRQDNKFVDHVDLITRPLDISTVTNRILRAFNIDTATGKQLDIIGLWIGRTREVQQLITGVYFSWDTEGLGYEQGVWKGPFDPDYGYTTLSDETYRIILKAKIAINSWNGQNDTLPPIIDAALAGSGISMQVIDNQDMTISIKITADGAVSDLSLELLAAINQGYLTIKAAGVTAREIEITGAVFNDN
ncbi:DUF2612 domain-containing protein [Salmonella enterica]